MKQVDMFGKRIEKNIGNITPTPHLNKLKAALDNPKCKQDVNLISESIRLYEIWIEKLAQISSKGKERVKEMTQLLNWYKDEFEVELIMKRGSMFLRRQKGQLKLDNTILEEFFIHLIHPDILHGIDNLEQLAIGPQNAFMSLAFLSKSYKELSSTPNIVLKTKDQDFVVGKEIFYKFSSGETFANDITTSGSFVLAVLAAECKINLDKTMFQEAAGTAARLKQGCPISKYLILVEYLDMTPEDTRLTAIDNVFLLRHARRLPFEKRDVVAEVELQRRNFPIDAEVVWRFTQEIQALVDAVWYNPNAALSRGSFV